MIEQTAEEYKARYYSPDSRLVNFLSERLQTSKQLDKLYADGAELPPDLESKDRSLNTKKVRILNDIIFQAMADLTFFFKAIDLHPELQEIFENDIKNLLGVRYTASQGYAFMFVDLVTSIMIVRDVESRSSGKEQASDLRHQRDDFRLRLAHILQGIVLNKVNPFLPNVFRNFKSQHIVWDDLSRAWAWTEMLAYHVEDDHGNPHRSFAFDTSKLLSSK